MSQNPDIFENNFQPDFPPKIGHLSPLGRGAQIPETDTGRSSADEAGIFHSATKVGLLW